MARLTRAGVSLASAGLGLLALGMGLGNLGLLILAVFPLALLAIPLAQRPEARATGSRTLSTRTPRRGDAFDMELRVHPPEGARLVEVHAPLPGALALEQGTNLQLHTRQGPLGAIVRVRAPSRGQHALGPVRAQVIDPTGLLAPQVTEVAPAESVHVTPRARRAPHRRGANRRARLVLPEREEARWGVGSSDFRELREYAWGDPPKSINWKATAKRLGARAGHERAGTNPLVNEYEKEGRTTALVLLDGGEALRVGTNLETGLDHGAEAALAISAIFLSRGARVGAATYGASASPPAAPDAGPGQLPSIEKALSPAELDFTSTPVRAFQDLQAHLAGTRPVVVVVTRVTPANADALIEVAKRLRVLLRERRRALPLHVLDVRALGLVPPGGAGWDAAKRLVERADEMAARRLAEAGANVVSWRAGAEDLHSLLARKGFA